MLLDEPTSACAPDFQKRFFDLLRGDAQASATPSGRQLSVPEYRGLKAFGAVWSAVGAVLQPFGFSRWREKGF